MLDEAEKEFKFLKKVPGYFNDSSDTVAGAGANESTALCDSLMQGTPENDC